MQELPPETPAVTPQLSSTEPQRLNLKCMLEMTLYLFFQLSTVAPLTHFYTVLPLRGATCIISSNSGVDVIALHNPDSPPH